MRPRGLELNRSCEQVRSCCARNITPTVAIQAPRIGFVGQVVHVKAKREVAIDVIADNRIENPIARHFRRGGGWGGRGLPGNGRHVARASTNGQSKRESVGRPDITGNLRSPLQFGTAVCPSRTGGRRRVFTIHHSDPSEKYPVLRDLPRNTQLNALYRLIDGLNNITSYRIRGGNIFVFAAKERGRRRELSASKVPLCAQLKICRLLRIEPGVVRIGGRC